MYKYYRPKNSIPKPRATDARKNEQLLQRQVCDFLRWQYKDVVFISDQSGVNKSRYAAGMQKLLNSGKSIPDLFIVEVKTFPVFDDKANEMKYVTYGGLWIELKKEGTRIYLKDGVTPVADDHIRGQLAMRDKLRQKGYKAEISVGFEQTKQHIINYLGPPARAYDDSFSF